MRRDEPSWWYEDADTTRARLLAPLAWCWQRVAKLRWDRTSPYRSVLPVICVGNFTAGGTGKTPVAAAVADVLRQRGRTPVILTRGYGGRIRGPKWVEPSDIAADVGDEPLIHAARGPVVVARDRAAGAQLIESRDCASDVIVMDDGMQNPSLAKDLGIAVVDGTRGLGNGRVMPAGPLRAELDFQMGLIDCIIVVGSDKASAERTFSSAMKANLNKPLLTARVVPLGSLDWLTEGPILAWAGIGSPRRFFDMLRANGAQLVGDVAFPDHHMPSADDARRLLETAQSHRATLVTTEKDGFRICSAAGDVSALASASRTVKITLQFDDADAALLSSLIGKALTRTQ